MAIKYVPVEVVAGGVVLNWNGVGDAETGQWYTTLCSVPLGPQIATIHPPMPSVVL